MRSIAEFIMRGRMQAMLVVAIMVFPDLFWIGAAAASLVLLRRGINQVLPIALVGLVIGLVSWYFDKPLPFFVLISALVLAYVLRITVSWVYVLVVSVLLSIVCYWIFYFYPTHLMVMMTISFAQQLPNILQESNQITAEQSIEMVKVTTPMVIPLFYTIGMQGLAIVSLMLGRYWQSLLYNPGGFWNEFYQLRIPIGIMTALVIGMLIVPSILNSLLVLTFLCSIPLAFAGLSLVHTMLAKSGMNMGIVIFYTLFIIAFLAFYPLLVILAIIDSFLNLRKIPSKVSS